MADNKVKGARFSPEIQKKLDAYTEIFGWDFGQTVIQLLNYRDRINAIASRIEVCKTNQGGLVMVDRHDSEDGGLLNEEAVAYWLVEQLQMSIAEGFRDSFLGYDEPWKE